MIWQILPHATLCIVRDRPVILDLRQDRYFQVPSPLITEAVAWLDRGYACDPPSPIAALLVRSGISRDRDPAATNALKDRVSIPEYISSASQAPLGRAGLAGVALRTLSAWARLRSLPFQTLMNNRRFRSPIPFAIDDVAVAEADRFERSRSLVPIARNCLLDSFALDSWLARRGIGAQFVFGVAIEPFAAHCWLQTPRALLNDSYDHASSFTPILAV